MCNRLNIYSFKTRGHRCSCDFLPQIWTFGLNCGRLNRLQSFIQFMKCVGHWIYRIIVNHLKFRHCVVWNVLQMRKKHIRIHSIIHFIYEIHPSFANNNKNRKVFFCIYIFIIIINIIINMFVYSWLTWILNIRLCWLLFFLVAMKIQHKY